MNRCKQCSNEFESVRNDAKFCGETCRNNYWNFKIKENKKSYKTLDELTKEDIEKIKVSRPDLKIRID